MHEGRDGPCAPLPECVASARNGNAGVAGKGVRAHRSARRLVIGLAVLAQGCAGAIGAKQPVVIPGAIPPAWPLAPLANGRFVVTKGRPGIVIAAPHGTSDGNTDVLGRDLAQLTGWSLVVVTGFSSVDGDRHRLNVNRPTESVPGAPAAREEQSEQARAVYETYRRRVDEAAQGPLLLYIELHGNGRQESAGRVEIATVGLSREDAWRLKTLFELIRDSRLADAETPRLQVWVETLDPLRYTASAAKRWGILSHAPRALHIELPRVARAAYRDLYTALLAEFLRQSAPVLLTGAR
jgi:hypothetical protein